MPNEQPILFRHNATVTDVHGGGTGIAGAPIDPPLAMSPGDSVWSSADGTALYVYRDGKLAETYRLRDGAYRVDAG